MQIVNEHNENVEWYKNNTDAIDAAGDKAREAAASAAAAAESANTAGEKASQASQSASAAASSQSAASASATAAKKSETNAAASQKSAATSASTATTKASEAATSARDAAASKEAAKSSETSAASSASNAASSATAAGNSAKAAKTSETNARSSETAAGQSASAAAGSKTAAASSASAASTSAGQASASATAAGKSAESAASSASTATTKAGQATEQASAAARSASAAKTSETNAKASETRAESSKTAAASSASSAASSASSASASKDEATRQASAAKGSATTASTKATEAAGSATAAAQSKSTAESAATRAETAAKRAEDIASAVALEDASTTKKGIVQLSSATNSTSETLAATPKAVKTVKDSSVQKTGDTMGGQLKISTINALRIFNQAFGLIFRRSEEYLHLIPTNEGEGENGNIGPLRPFSINLRTGLVSIGNGVKVGGGITGGLTGNADTATKIKTARKIGGVAFDGSADINLPGVNATGNQNTTGNAATATKLQTARTIGGVSFDGTANINLPGVNTTGNQNTTGNAATATKLQTARTINGVSFDGSENISLSPANIGCPASPTGWLTTGSNGGAITTAQLVTLLQNNGAFNTKSWIARCAWAYANSATIPNSETGCGVIPLAGAVIEVFNNGSSSNNYTIRITTATTTSVSGALTNAEFIYVFNGTDYSPGWRRVYNTKNKPTASDVGALPLTGGTLSGGLTSSGEIISKYANGFRIACGSFGFFIRNDGSNTYFMLTASGDTLGSWNGLRPIIINNTSGAVTIGNGLNVTGGINGSLNGNAATATKLQTARTIGGVSFDGSANINLPGVNIAGNQNTTGNAATATKLATARNINGVKFDGSGDININTLVSRGRVTALSGSTQGTAGIQMYEAYNNSYPTTYGNVLHMKGASAAGEGELLIGWSGTDGAHAPVYVRSRRDTSTANWSGWAQVYTTAHKPTAADVGALPISGGTMTGVLTLQNVGQPLKTQGGGILANDGNLYINKSGFAGWIDALFMKNSGGTMSGQLKIRSTDGLRIYDAAYGMIFRRSENNFYLIPTAKDQGENGDIGSLRPFYVNLTNGRVTMGNGAVVDGGLGLGVVNGLGGNSIVLGDNDTGFKQNGDGILDVYANSAHVFRFVNSTLQSLKPLSVTGDIASSAWVYANRFSINSGSGAWIDMRNQNVIFGGNAVSTNSAQALLRQDHADRKFFLGGLGNSQFGFYMINNSRTANGTDAAAYLQNDGTWVCAGNGSFNDVYIRSDRRSKRNIRKIERALDKLDRIEGVLYEIQVCDRYEQSGGLIAQDVQNVQPELVTVDHNDQSGEPRLRLNYNGVIGMLVEAVKELREEVRELKAKM
ncbi:tail fiber domain-containing protein [Escherichia coli]|uniref:phage tail fiber protein n=2 Tax=Escherichia coli TaxID=562 RepID=UPI003FA58F31